MGSLRHAAATFAQIHAPKAPADLKKGALQSTIDSFARIGKPAPDTPSPTALPPVVRAQRKGWWSNAPQDAYRKWAGGFVSGKYSPLGAPSSPEANSPEATHAAGSPFAEGGAYYENLAGWQHAEDPPEPPPIIVAAPVPTFAKAEDFDESKHPRADDGKFGSGSGSAAAKPDKPAKAKVTRRKLADNGVRLDVGDETSRVKAHESEGVLYVDTIQQWAYSPEERAATFHAILAEAKRRPDVYVVDVWLEDARQLTAAESALGKPVRFDDSDRAKIDDGRPVLCRFEARALRVRGEAADALAEAHDLHLQHRVAGMKVNEREPWVTPSEDDARDIHEAMDRTWGTLDAYNEREDHSPIRVAMQRQHCFENGHGDHGRLEVTGNKTTAGSKRFREMISHEIAHCMETQGDFKEKFAAFQTWMKERVEEMRDPNTRVVPWARILSPHGLGTMSGGSSSFNEEWAQALANYVLHEEEGELRHADPRFNPTVEAIEKVAELVGKPVKWRPGEREKMRSFKDPAPDPDAPYEMSDERRAELRARIAEREAAESAKAE